MTNIFITRKIPEICKDMLLAKGYQVSVGEKETPLSKEELINCIKNKNYQAVVTLLTDKIDAEIFDVCPEIKIFVNYATGFDNIDIEEAKKRGITVANSPTESSKEAVAQFTIAMLVSLANKIVDADNFVRAGKYKGWSPENFVGQSIRGKKLGIVGVGRIGEKVAEIVFNIGISITYYDQVENQKLEEEFDADRAENLDELLQNSDFITLHLPLDKTTYHILNKDNLFKIKSGAILINTGRGGLVDEEALVRVLEEGVLQGVGLDVFEKEPEVNNKLLSFPNVILTPHIASATREARDEMAIETAFNLIDFFDGQKPRHSVI